jgi:NAD(P)-dependent dehydrogenase (short-subunit alcohol dehydrogenase family)
MGRATALAVARAGGHPVLAARSGDALTELERAVESEGGEATVVVGDLTKHENAEALVDQLRSRFDHVHGAVVTIGTNLKERALSQLTPQSWEHMLATNLTASFNITQAIVPMFRDQQDGLLIYISSSAAKRPELSGVAYQATKAGLVGLANGTMEEERANGIRTTVVFPGLTDTPMVLKRPQPTPADVLARALQPEDVAAACVFVMQLPPRAHVPELVLYPSRP